MLSLFSMSDSLQLHGLQPSGSSAHGFSRQEYWNRWPCTPPGALFPTQSSNPCLLHLLHCRWILYCWVTREAQFSLYFSSNVLMHIRETLENTGKQNQNKITSSLCSFRYNYGEHFGLYSFHLLKITRYFTLDSERIENDIVDVHLSITEVCQIFCLLF